MKKSLLNNPLRTKKGAEEFLEKSAQGKLEEKDIDNRIEVFEDFIEFIKTQNLKKENDSSQSSPSLSS